MKKIVLFVLLTVGASALCTGCDWIRASLGKPTSKELNAIRSQLAQREQALRDSLRAVQAERRRQKAAADTLAAPAAQQPAVPASEPASVPASGKDLKRYYAVAGAFRDASGAQRYGEKLRENGFRIRLLEFKSGLTAVCIEGSDTLDAVQRDVAALKQLRIAPSDPWIYDTNQKLHKQI